MKAPTTILILAPHTDDGEFGCGGTIARYVSEGARAIYVAFSAAEQSVLPHLPSDILRTEVRSATAKLGVLERDCLVLDFEVRRFPELRQQILDKMIELNREFNPDMVFLPSANDTHQDHQTIAQEGFRAFKRTTMLGYEVPWNNLDFRTSCFVDIGGEHLERKIQAIGMYESQKHRSYANSEFIRSLAITRGVQIGKQYAEAFEVVRWVIS
ncbi:LmbE family N-acetylglucosaminyl deacetylase [Variovorax boronicumulans]|uniref:LmbE family N-acetylglucosaminyl deacetylase n=1 Tax=Variovorax boronicumulans TaxID=436515 RepID=A0AAW8E519_9BURK|nr:PIG-L deacetylase family protein [Variovorax boronicumulans]MDP9881373.1 LmbE family N-acetylglucosaminyl deacetylase [Variovorax boronicumulans]MDP9926660.1 LmbE family N-acetylglucosaminyl deacetylase [Variovorax boronicumulans]